MLKDELQRIVSTRAKELGSHCLESLRLGEQEYQRYRFDKDPQMKIDPLQMAIDRAVAELK